MSTYPTKSIKIKYSTRVIFDVLFSVFKKNKDSFTLLLMREANLRPDTLNKFESINEFYLFLSNNFFKELETKKIETINLEIRQSGRIQNLESLIDMRTNVRENINFRINGIEIKKIKKIKDEYHVFPLGVIVETMIELYVAQLSLTEFILVERVLRG